ncbi:MAG: metallophosphoesterase [Rubrivivax sp.]|nr:metallophosphoesterase [Rubrivivax sp.]
MIVSRLRRAVLAAALALPLAGAATAAPEAANSVVPFSFAVVGDMPYNATQVLQFDALIDDINADGSVRFVLHVGDLKGGSERCDDTLIRERLAQLDRVRRAVVYTPGDNDWTDCHRTNNGAYNPVERLGFLRSVAYPKPGLTRGSQPMRVESQNRDPAFADFVENQLFVRGQVVFAAVHVVGSANNLAPWTGIDPTDSVTAPRADRLADYTTRLAAAQAWIDRAFDEAAARDAPGVVVFFQANPGIEAAQGDARRAGFEEVLAKLKARSLAFGKPVLLVHGDFHELLFDQPLVRDAEPAPKVPKFQRLQSIGAPRIHWVKVDVDPRESGLFVVKPQWVPGSP